jgi:hypothetical protein
MVSLGSATVAVLVLSLLAACGSASSGSAGEAGNDSASLSATTPPTMSQTPPPAKSPSDQIKPRTVRGTVVRGFEPGCVELVGPAGRWALIGAAAEDLVPGDDVEIVGLPAPELTTSCDGAPLKVREVRTL